MKPHPFLYGACTSAHQVEGGSVNNNWWQFEKTQPKEFRSGKACDHWNRFKEDILLAHQLGHTAHRFSLEWSKIEPNAGKFDASAIAHYREVLLELKKYNIKSMVTLHHFTNPLWIERANSWESSETPERFALFAKYCALHLGDLVDYWVTINEPMVFAVQSYYKGIWPPQKQSLFVMVRVIRNLAKGHLLAYKALKKITPTIPIGLANSQVAYSSSVKNWWYNHRFFTLIKNNQDFIGVNYYFGDVPKNEIVATSDLGWPVYPQGLTTVLLNLKKYNKPIIITENGIADASDRNRAQYIRSHIRAIEKAQEQGADVRGYFHWALLDNFEWAEGFAPRFGLIEIDYETQKRTIRKSAYVYKAIIEQAKSVVK